MQAAISADIVSSTSLAKEDTIRLKSRIEELFELLGTKYPGFWGRLIKGDYMECIVPRACDALRIALIIKTYIKSFEPSPSERSTKDFQTYGLRMAVGIGGMRTSDPKEGIMDGEAIYLSGRAVGDMEQLFKGTMRIRVNNEKLAPALNTIAILTDALLNSATQRQSQVLYYKLMGYKETDIAGMMNIKQSSVNRHSSQSKWYSIEETLDYFEHINFDDYE